MGGKNAILVIPLRRGRSACNLEGMTLSQDASPARRPAATAAEAAPEDGQQLFRILSSLEDDKAEDIVTIDLRGRSAMADHMVIASGRSARQVGAIAEHLAEKVKAATGSTPRIEGKDAGDWVLIDTDDVIVHIFRPEVRDFYQLEKMWMPAEALSRGREASARPAT